MFGAAQAVEVEDRERAEDRQPGDAVDDVAVRDRDEQADDPEHDQASSAQNSVRAHEDRSRRVA